MNLEGKVERTVNEKGNQQLKVTGRIFTAAGHVLPIAASDYDVRLLKFDASTGEILFEFEVEALNAPPQLKAPKSVAELSRQEQAAIFEAQGKGQQTHEAVKDLQAQHDNMSNEGGPHND